MSSRARAGAQRAHLKTRVLVVEDEQDIAGLIKHTLERGGDMDVHIVGSGDGALKAAVEQPPDVILLDLNLPVLSGIEVCRLLRSRAATKSVPIIMPTANHRERSCDRPRCRRGRLREQTLQPARTGRTRAGGAAARAR